MSKKLEALASAMNECYTTRDDFINENAYQWGRTGKDQIFTNGDEYFAIGKKAPKTEVGKPWVPHKDQFWAEKLGMTIWVSERA